MTAEDLNALRAVPGVKAVANSNMLPFGGSSWNSSASTMPDDPEAPINAAMYMGSEDLLEAFGIDVVAGRDFTADEYVDYEEFRAEKVKLGSVIISSFSGTTG